MANSTKKKNSQSFEGRLQRRMKRQDDQSNAFHGKATCIEVVVKETEIPNEDSNTIRVVRINEFRKRDSHRKKRGYGGSNVSKQRKNRRLK